MILRWVTNSQQHLGRILALYRWSLDMPEMQKFYVLLQANKKNVVHFIQRQMLDVRASTDAIWQFYQSMRRFR
jgi:hypothetical protein